MNQISCYPECADDLTEEERIAICAALDPQQANKSPENRALWPKDRRLTAKEKMAWSRRGGGIRNGSKYRISFQNSGPPPGREPPPPLSGVNRQILHCFPQSKTGPAAGFMCRS